MTLEQNFQRRTPVHNRKRKAAAFQQRAAVVPPKPNDPAAAKPDSATTTTTKAVAATPPTKPTVTPDPKSATTSEKTTPSAAAAPPPSKATASTSPLSSITSAAPPPPTSSSSIVPSSSSSPPSTTSHSSSALSRALPSTTLHPVAPTSAAQADATHSAAPTTTSGLGTMTLVGIIFGSLIGVAVVCVVIAFIVRHLRKKRGGADAFDSAKFRRSAVMLDEKDQEPDFRPRPPTMIERRQGVPAPASGGANNFPPPPTMAYPYYDQAQSAAVPSAPPAMHGAANPQYGNLPPPPPPPQATMYNAIPGAYGVPAPGAFGAQYDQAGYGAPPVPGTYAPGAYAPYGAASDPRYPQHLQQQGYPQYSNSAYQQQPAVAYGPRMDSLSNSMSNSALVEKQALRAAEESSAIKDIGAGMMTASPSSMSSSSSSSGGSSLRRQPTQVGGAPPAYVDEDGEGAKAAARSDVKVKPVIMSPPGLGGSKTGATGLAPGTAASGSKANRPTSAFSSYSLYDQDDAYGGI